MPKSAYGYIVKSSVIFITISFLLTSYSVHPHYVGITEIEYIPSKKEIQISCKWFVDDLEDALKAYSAKKFNITNNPDVICNDSIIKSYMRSHVRLQTDNKDQIIQCVGAEIEKGAVWVYWKAENISGYNMLNFYNDLFCESHADQIHLIHYKLSGKRETQKLSCKNPLASFK